MFDDDLPQKKTAQNFPRNLELLSVAELESYITELDQEKQRVQADIDKKKASQAAAASIFKS